jgi:hypothetical protein
MLCSIRPKYSEEPVAELFALTAEPKGGKVGFATKIESVKSGVSLADNGAY